MSTYAKVKQEYEEKSGVSLESGRLPCRWCHTLTETRLLSLYGARCTECFQAYCREGQIPASALPDKNDSPKAWAYALKAREESGERLTSAQRGMWRSALRAQFATAGDEA